MAWRVTKHVCLVLLFLCTLSYPHQVLCYYWEPCDIIPEPGCTCWDPDRPSVSCTHLNLTQIPSTLAENHRDWPTIELLDLSFNNFYIIYGNNFRYLAVEKLVLAHNSKQMFLSDAGVFQGTIGESLLSLDLSDSGLSEVPAYKVFSHLKNLRELDLSNNAITSVSSNFASLRTLKKINLKGNPISYISEYAFSRYTHLEELHISYESGRSKVIRDIRNAEHLKILEVADSSMDDLQQRDISLFPSLESLSVVGCSLRSYGVEDSRVLRQIRQTLHTLSLARNQLSWIPKKLIYRLSVLITLDLSQNQISVVNDRDFAGLEALQHLDLSNNIISSVSSSAFQPTPQLESLRLNNNALNFLSEDIISNEHAMLYIGGNPWWCTCKVQWLVEMAAKELYNHQPGPLSLYDIQHNLMCDRQPSQFAGKRLVDLYNNEDYTERCDQTK